LKRSSSFEVCAGFGLTVVGFGVVVVVVEVGL
jgi:hypothetical protein